MKLLAALLLIGVTSAPALAGPATGYRSRGVMLNKKSATVENIEKNIFQAP